MTAPALQTNLPENHLAKLITTPPTEQASLIQKLSLDQLIYLCTEDAGESVAVKAIQSAAGQALLSRQQELYPHQLRTIADGLSSQSRSVRESCVSLLEALPHDQRWGPILQTYRLEGELVPALGNELRDKLLGDALPSSATPSAREGVAALAKLSILSVQRGSRLATQLNAIIKKVVEEEMAIDVFFSHFYNSDRSVNPSIGALLLSSRTGNAWLVKEVTAVAKTLHYDLATNIEGLSKWLATTQDGVEVLTKGCSQTGVRMLQFWQLFDALGLALPYPSVTEHLRAGERGEAARSEVSLSTLFHPDAWYRSVTAEKALPVNFVRDLLTYSPLLRDARRASVSTSPRSGIANLFMRVLSDPNIPTTDLLQAARTLGPSFAASEFVERDDTKKDGSTATRSIFSLLVDRLERERSGREREEVISYILKNFDTLLGGDKAQAVRFLTLQPTPLSTQYADLDLAVRQGVKILALIQASHGGTARFLAKGGRDTLYPRGVGSDDDKVAVGVAGYLAAIVAAERKQNRAANIFHSRIRDTMVEALAVVPGPRRRAALVGLLEKAGVDRAALETCSVSRTDRFERVRELLGAVRNVFEAFAANHWICSVSLLCGVPTLINSSGVAVEAAADTIGLGGALTAYGVLGLAKELLLGPAGAAHANRISALKVKLEKGLRVD